MPRQPTGSAGLHPRRRLLTIWPAPAIGAQPPTPWPPTGYCQRGQRPSASAAGARANKPWRMSRMSFKPRPIMASPRKPLITQPALAKSTYPTFRMRRRLRQVSDGPSTSARSGQGAAPLRCQDTGHLCGHRSAFNLRQAALCIMFSARLSTCLAADIQCLVPCPVRRNIFAKATTHVGRHRLVDGPGDALVRVFGDHSASRASGNGALAHGSLRCCGAGEFAGGRADLCAVGAGGQRTVAVCPTSAGLWRLLGGCPCTPGSRNGRTSPHALSTDRVLPRRTASFGVRLCSEQGGCNE